MHVLNDRHWIGRQRRQIATETGVYWPASLLDSTVDYNKVEITKHHDVREIRQVVKRAKAFEIQRTFKKLKKARYALRGTKLVASVYTNVVPLSDISIQKASIRKTSSSKWKY